ncbi:MAG TPA: DotI/IcmL/TraM family protein [Gammaproteobacteria bacterium]|jgi:intracellular multiplication protein IcmL|nr:DotI/IcmL/TraM family protein [Gammaproteobacteria bacterium]
MAEEGVTVVTLQDNFYRDSFGKVIFIIGCLSVSILFLAAISIYIFTHKPPPTTFRVAEEWRVMAPVPIQQPYLSSPDLLQWVSEVVPGLFDLDFLNMDSELEDAKKYFTKNGYQIYLNQLQNYADKDMVRTYKMFVHGEPSGAPTILNQGVLSGRYAWWVQIPVKISYAGSRDMIDNTLTLQVLVVRTETTDNLTGILIDNLIVEKGNEKSLTGTAGG